MKKISLLVAMALLLVSLVGCRTAPTDGPDKKEPSDKNVPSDTTEPSEAYEQVEDFGFITVLKHSKYYEEWGDESPAYFTGWSNLTISPDDEEKYPLLWEYFDTLNSENDSYATEQMEFLSDCYNEEIGMTLYSREEPFVLRADKEVVSIRTDYEDYTGGVHGYYANFGYNIDPETGKELSLFDVVTDKDALYKNIVDYLIEYDDWEFNEERRSDLYEQFDEGLMWTIDYDKLTIYFNPYDIASFAAGLIKYNLWFEEYPELVKEEYRNEPSSFAVQLSAFDSYDFDRSDKDADKDTILVGGYGDDDYFNCDRIYISVNDNEFYDDGLCGTHLDALLVKHYDKYFVYAEIGNDNGSNTLHIYDVSTDDVKKCGKIDAGFKKIWQDDEFGGYSLEIVNNPNKMNLESYLRLLDTPNSAYKSYSANKKTGIPETDDEYFTFNEDNGEKITLCDIKVTMLPDGEELTLPEGTTLMPEYTDGKTYVDFVFEAGQKCRVNIDINKGINTVDGKAVEECFEDKWYVYEDNTGFISFDEASAILCEIEEVKSALAEGMVIVDYDMIEYINDIPHFGVALSTDYDEQIVPERIFAVAPNSVYEFDSVLGDWTAVGFG